MVIEGEFHTQRRMPFQKRCQGVQQGRGERGGGGYPHRARDPDRCAQTAGGGCKREGRTSHLGEEALTVRREGECAGRAAKQARAMRDFEAAHQAGDGGRGHAQQPRGPGEGTGLGDAENNDGSAQSVHRAFDTSGWLSCNTVCPALHLPGRQHSGGIGSGRAVMRIGIVGVGPVGRTLGTIWARVGHEVAFGSRDPARAAEAAMGLAGGRATTQEEAMAFGEVVLWTSRGVMPADPEMLARKIVLDPNNRGPGPDGSYASPRPEGPSFAEQLQAAAPRARVVKAFNTVVMRLLREDPERLRVSGAQVFLAGDDAAAKAATAGLAAEIGLGAVDLGGLEAAWMAEVMADTFRQAMLTSPAGWRQALVFADLTK